MAGDARYFAIQQRKISGGLYMVAAHSLDV
jgi:hypothetical protein